MGADNHHTVTVDREIPDVPEWAVWIRRCGAGYKMPFLLEAESEQQAQVKAEHSVNRVLDGVGVSFKRGGDYTVEVRRLIE